MANKGGQQPKEGFFEKKEPNPLEIALSAEQIQNKILEAAECSLLQFQDEHPSLQKIAEKKNINIQKQPVRKILDLIKSLTGMDKKKAIVEHAKHVAAIDKMEKEFKHLMEKCGKIRVKYSTLSPENKKEIDTVYKKLVKKIKAEANHKKTDYSKIIADLDIARRFDVVWFEDMARHYGIKVKLHEGHWDHSNEKSIFKKLF